MLSIRSSSPHPNHSAPKAKQHRGKTALNVERTPPRLMHRTPMRTAFPGPPAYFLQAKFPLPLSSPTPSHPHTVWVY
ncbi:hypothetical protein AMECASPLE_005980 [Ameca splendens]|uniref:Uncharacterized protein n=1 Tax=Ameca splendens TaxID=208324 RepID=A0ABV0ZW61_9TELE